jgi:molybdenum cofactor cytidylyltransferase
MIGAIVLAAGGSSRLGSPKQLLNYRGRTLLEHVLECVLHSKCDETVVVIGAYAERVRQVAKRFPVRVVENKRWHSGKASSIRAGLESLIASHREIEAALIVTCDQVFLTTDHLDKLIDTYRTTGRPIAASAYSGVIGVPVLFDKSFFPRLMSLEGEQGAKGIIAQCPNQAATVAFPEGNIDIDSPEDYGGVSQ